jgi:hypothetical protein
VPQENVTAHHSEEDAKTHGYISSYSMFIWSSSNNHNNNNNNKCCFFLLLLLLGWLEVASGALVL